jgi:hypothetical protein
MYNMFEFARDGDGAGNGAVLRRGDTNLLENDVSCIEDPSSFWSPFDFHIAPDVILRSCSRSNWSLSLFGPIWVESFHTIEIDCMFSDGVTGVNKEESFLA